MRSLIISIFVLLTFALHANAQSQENPESSVITFDPLFWKDRLKLNLEQRSEIARINAGFYQSLMETAKQEKNRDRLISRSSQLMQDRSEKIWHVFSERQKRIWKKMSSEYGDLGSPELSLRYTEQQLLELAGRS
jgi:hypothetical protein